MSSQQSSGRRICPGEKCEISAAICRARQRNHYPKCLLCKYHNVEYRGAPDSDPKVQAAIFRHSTILGKVPAQLNEYVMRKIGAALAQLARAGNASAVRLAVAHDLREHSRSLCKALCDGINQAGLDAISLGAAPEEVLRFVLGTQEFAGAAYVCGGNNAKEVNGLRIFRRDGSQVGFSNGLDKIGLIARRLRSGRTRRTGQRGFLDLSQDYRSYVLKFARGLKQFKLAVDASCGIAARTIPFVFEKLPVEVLPSHFDVEGRPELLGTRFPAKGVSSAVKRNIVGARAPLGAAIDFAGDRIAFFDETGALLRNDAAAAFIAEELLHRQRGGRVVYDLRASAALKEHIAWAGGQALPCPTDQLSIMQEMRQKDAVYGADVLGRHFFKDFFRSSSPIISLLLLCSFVCRKDKKLSRLASEFARYSHSGEIRIKTPSPDAAAAIIEKLKEHFRDADRDLLDGLTVRTESWWFNLRQPPGSAEVRLNLEGRTPLEERRRRQEMLQLVKELAATPAK